MLDFNIAFGWMNGIWDSMNGMAFVHVFYHSISLSTYTYIFILMHIYDAGNWIRLLQQGPKITGT